MGLDIKVFKCLTPISGAEIDKEGYPVAGNQWIPGVSMTLSEKQWPGRGSPLNPSMAYRFVDSMYFEAGSYHWYTHFFRYPLFDLIGAARPIHKDWYVPEGPFHELLDFADNEGVIGSIVSKKLAQDFADWQERADALARSGKLKDAEYFSSCYSNFRKAFEMAAENGAVEFG